MRSLGLLGLAACWSSSPAPSTARAETPPPIATTKPAAAPTPAPAAPAPKYVLPSRVASALAAESLDAKANVLVPHGVTLQATQTAAKSETETMTWGTPRAMSVVRDHGDVIEVSTAPTKDCAEDFDEPYQLTVFVKREKLYPRTKVEVAKTFPDGTAVAIDRGAPVEPGERGMVWESRSLAETKVAPSEAQLTYAVPNALLPTPLPKPVGERMLCERDAPMTMTEWRAERQRTRDEEMRREAERQREEAEARRIEEAKEAKEAKKAKTQSKKQADDATRFADMLTAREPGSDLSRYDVDERYAPWCGVADPSSYSMSQAPPKTSPPTANRNVLSWPSYSRDNEHVFRSGSQYLADVGYTCGRVRMAVEREGVHRRGGGAGMGGGGQIKVWVPAAGPVTWPDGTPAGKYTGSKRYRNVVENGDRICVNVNGIAELVCHAKKTAKQEMSSRFVAD